MKQELIEKTHKAKLESTALLLGFNTQYTKASDSAYMVGAYPSGNHRFPLSTIYTRSKLDLPPSEMNTDDYMIPLVIHSVFF